MSQHLDTDKKYINDLFDSSSFYNVPDYQRPYVWEDEQIIALLEDVYKAWEKDAEKEYFLGCMIWNTKEQVQNGISYKCQDILDGQQRFITLYLLLAVIRDLSKSQDIKSEIGEQMKQNYNKYKKIPERQRIEFEVREDADFLTKFVISQEGTLKSEELEKEARKKDISRSARNMANALLVMHKWWRAKTMEVPNFQTTIEQFYIYLGNKVLVLYLATPNNLDDAYNLFTILNSRGVQLRPGDILKAQNLREIPNEQLRKKYALKWAEYEDSIDEPFGSFDAFLWALVDVKMKYRSDENKTLSIAFDHMDKNHNIKKGEGFFQLVDTYIKHYRDIIDFSVDDECDMYFKNIIHILMATSVSKFITPLMHYCECFGMKYITEFLIKLDNLLSVMWILGKRDMDTRLFIIMRRMEELLSKLSKEDAAKALIEDEVLQYEYKHVSGNTHIDINEFYEMLDVHEWGNVSGNRINKIKYLLLKLDLMVGDRSSNIQYNSKSSSLEHVMPQNIQKTTWEVSEERHAEWCHRLGNLVLLGKRKNASISNSTYNVKKMKYADSIESYAYTNRLFMTHENWTIEAIINNHNASLSLLKKYYSGNSLATLLDIHKTKK